MADLKAQINQINTKINAWLKDFPNKLKTLPDKLKNLPNTLKAMPQEQLIAIGAIVLGVIFIILAILLW